QPDEVEQGLFLGRGRRRHVVIKAPGLSFGDVPVGEGDDAHPLPTAEGTGDLDYVPGLHLAMRLRGLAIEVDLPSATGLLCLRSCLEQTRDIEPDVEAEGVRSVFHRN